MSISVIIPTCNESLRIRQLVYHLTERGGDLLKEIIVVDASATDDDTLAQVPEGKAIAIKSEATCRAIQMNQGAKIAQGDILYFVHADVIPPANFPMDIYASLAKGYDFGFFSYNFDSPKVLLKFNSYFTRFPNIFTGGGDQTFYTSRSLFEAQGGFDEKIVMMEDFDFFYKLKKAGLRYEIINNPVLVSARKYEKNSYLKVNLVNLITMILFRSGYRLDYLKQFYHNALKG